MIINNMESSGFLIHERGIENREIAMPESIHHSRWGKQQRLCPAILRSNRRQLGVVTDPLYVQWCLQSVFANLLPPRYCAPVCRGKTYHRCGILPLQENVPICLPSNACPLHVLGAHLAALEEVELVPVYRAVIHTKPHPASDLFRRLLLYPA